MLKEEQQLTIYLRLYGGLNYRSYLNDRDHVHSTTTPPPHPPQWAYVYHFLYIYLPLLPSSLLISLSFPFPTFSSLSLRFIVSSPFLHPLHFLHPILPSHLSLPLLLSTWVLASLVSRQGVPQGPRVNPSVSCTTHTSRFSGFVNTNIHSHYRDVAFYFSQQMNTPFLDKW